VGSDAALAWLGPSAEKVDSVEAREGDALADAAERRVRASLAAAR
jgi:hypothetical protein